MDAAWQQISPRVPELGVGLRGIGLLVCRLQFHTLAALRLLVLLVASTSVAPKILKQIRATPTRPTQVKLCEHMKFAKFQGIMELGVGPDFQHYLKNA